MQPDHIKYIETSKQIIQIWFKINMAEYVPHLDTQINVQIMQIFYK